VPIGVAAQAVRARLVDLAAKEGAGHADAVDDVTALAPAAVAVSLARSVDLRQAEVSDV